MFWNVWENADKMNNRHKVTRLLLAFNFFCLTQKQMKTKKKEDKKKKKWSNSIKNKNKLKKKKLYCRTSITKMHVVSNISVRNQ